MPGKTEPTLSAVTTKPMQELSTAVVERVVDEIRTIQAKATLQMALKVGECVVTHFYNGDLSVLRERGRKDVSLRTLAKHPNLPFSASTLYNAVGLYELADRHQSVHTCEHLSSGHLRHLLGLSENRQATLIAAGEKGAWTVEKMREEAGKVRAKEKTSAGGRPALPMFVKSIHAMNKFATGGDDVFADLDQLNNLDQPEVAQLRDTVAAVRARCEELEQRFQTRILAVAEANKE